MRSRQQAQSGRRFAFLDRYRTIYMSPLVPVIGIILVVFGIIGGVLFLRESTGRPRVTDHWHGSYQIVVCGEEIPYFPASDATPGIHTHGDGLIHLHPNSSDDEGKAGNLARFFRGLDVTFNENLLRLPDGREFRNGDACPDGQAGTLRMYVGRTSNIFGGTESCSDYKENDKFEEYVIREGGTAEESGGDCVLIEFGPESASLVSGP